MADQTFDAMYFRRAYVYDADLTTELDRPMTLCSLPTTVFSQLPGLVPTEVLLPLFEDAGHGPGSTSIRGIDPQVGSPGSGAAETNRSWCRPRAHFSWGNAHLNDRSVPGSPPRG